MSVAALFMLARRWNHSEFLAVDDEINKMWYVHTIEYYSATKRNDALTQATTWVNLDLVMLSEKASHKKAPYYRILLIGNVPNRQICRDRKQVSCSRGLEGGNGK